MRLRNAVLVLLVACLSAVFVVACSDDDDGDGSSVVETPESVVTDAATSVAGTGGDAGGGDSELTITAEDNEFDKDELTAPAQTEVSIEFSNQDEGVLHNFSVYQSSDAQEAIFKGDLITGVETTTYTFETPEAGEYFFHCDVHPDMTGTFVVE